MRDRAMIGAAMLLALTACGGRPGPLGVERGETLLATSGTGRAEARPDQAIFTAGLESIGPDAAAASGRANQAVARIVAALKPLGIGERDIQTSSLSIGRIGYGPNRGRFQASNVVTVKVRKVDQAGAAIAAATQAGANVLSGPNLSVVNPEAATLSAHGLAYKAARAKADAYARAAGLKVVRVVAITDGGESGAMPMMQSETMDAVQFNQPAPVVAAPVLAGTNAQTVTVRVEFALRP